MKCRLILQSQDPSQQIRRAAWVSEKVDPLALAAARIIGLHLADSMMIPSQMGLPKLSKKVDMAGYISFLTTATSYYLG